MRGVRGDSRPLEVVVLLDIVDVEVNGVVVFGEARERIKEAANLVINSLITGDKVGW